MSKRTGFYLRNITYCKRKVALGFLLLLLLLFYYFIQKMGIMLILTFLMR